MPGRVKRVVTHTAIEHVESHDQGKSNRRSSRISEPAKHAGSLKAKHGTHDDPADETQETRSERTGARFDRWAERYSMAFI